MGLADAAKAVIHSNSYVSATGDFHFAQAVVDSTFAIYGDDLKAIANKCDPKITTDNRADFLVSNGSLNQSITFLFFGVLIALNKFKAFKYYECHVNDKRPIEESIFDIQQWWLELSKKSKVSLFVWI